MKGLQSNGVQELLKPVWQAACLVEVGEQQGMSEPQNNSDASGGRGDCGWQMKWDRWKVRFEVECGSSSDSVLPPHHKQLPSVRE